MRWHKKVIPQPEVGTKKVTKMFLWLPKTIGTETRWLEFVSVVEVYVKEEYDEVSDIFFWKETEFAA